MGANVPDFDLGSDTGLQEFRNWVTKNTKNEINSYTRQAMALPNSGLEDLTVNGDSAVQYFDGGTPYTKFENFYLTGNPLV